MLGILWVLLMPSDRFTSVFSLLETVNMAHSSGWSVMRHNVAVGSSGQVPEPLRGALGPWLIVSVCKGWERTWVSGCM